jgi:hypothetical protein
MSEEKFPPLVITPPGLYRHYKGNLYRVEGTVRHSETLEPMTLYRALYGEQGLWVRPAAMFEEMVEVDGRKQLRFTPVSEATLQSHADK